MTRDIPSAARALILMLAFAWPFGAILYIPFLDVTLLPAAGAVVVFLAIIDATNHRERRPPFELVWPVLVAIVLMWFDPEIENKVQYTIDLALFLAIVQFAYDERFVRNCLGATALGGCVVAGLALWNEFAELRELSPLLAQFIGRSPGILVAPMLTSPEALMTGAFTLTLCLLAALENWLRQRGSRDRIAIVVLSAMVLLFVALAPSLTKALFRIGLPETDRPGLVHGGYLVLLVWLLARVMAKAVVRGKEHDGQARSTVVLLGLALAGLALTPHASFPSLLIVPGILCSASFGAGQPPARTWPVSLCAIPAVIVLSLNLFHVHLENADDPRNYEAQLRRDIHANRLDRAWERLSLVRAWHEEERTWLWSARLALEFGYPYQSAEDFRFGMEGHRKGWSVLPPPSEAALDAYLVRLRDYCSTMPNPDQAYAYELALVAAGKEASALALLRRKAEVLRRSAGEPDKELPVRLILSTVLGCNEDSIKRSSLQPELVSILLTHWGLQIESNSLPNREFPVIAAIRFGTNFVTRTVVDFDRPEVVISQVFWLTHDARPAPLAADGMHSSPAWWEIVRAPDGTIDARLRRGKKDSLDLNADYVAVWEGPDFAVSAQGGFESPLPDKPAILILLP